MDKLGLTLGARALYQPPSWLSAASITPDSIPQERLYLGRFPTPVHSFNIPGIPEELGFECHIKRDDLSSFDLSGNKVRKLEFLLAEATKPGARYDSVITIGGIQSNHCRATAVAARQLGLDPFLILRKPLNKDASEEEPDMGLTGNLLWNRMIGADIRLVSPATYAMVGSDALCEQLADQLQAEGRHPYVIPVGGSNAVGAFGYMQFVEELIQTMGSTSPTGAGAGAGTGTGEIVPYDHIVFGCGSGGTAAGIALGARLSGLYTQTTIHAIGVCDTPEIFYGHIRDVAEELGLDTALLGDFKDWIRIYPGNGVGYARSTEAELEFILQVAQNTGIVLDPVYSGKALYYFVNHVLKQAAAFTSSSSSPSSSAQDNESIPAGSFYFDPSVFRPGQRVLFVHTGGTVGLYDKESQMLPLLPKEKVSRMKVSPPSPPTPNTNN
eukprot:CAMPEP_0174972468 /NCGR_PEP_ID=MMETSP0004_2-20121128/10648_1 /TAXON_ID=420556 /ORGANISM="Ochromonas sp., Strain CCMP1393" /LENGTH=439 /DNA_ID=CAMNT_0016222699 /DNA_START=21 /DNA_END=1340 /DNA_ORIENTATION=-